MITSQELFFFTEIANASSLASAARGLNVSPPAVSQRLKQLEEKLSVRLIERTRGAICLTSEGEMLLERARVILRDMEGLNTSLLEQRKKVLGPLRIIAPLGFGRCHVTKIMASFKAMHPKVSLNLTLSDVPLEAIQKGPWDILINIGALKDSSFIQRRLARNRRILCAAPIYIEKHGTPKRPHDLPKLACGVTRENQEDVTLWNFHKPNSTKITQRITPVFSSNDGTVVKEWAMSGLGIIERSQWDVAAELRAGALVQVLGDYLMPDADIIALLSSRTLRVARTQAFFKAPCPRNIGLGAGLVTERKLTSIKQRSYN